jgi:Protein of unknown function (DUF3137)
MIDNNANYINEYVERFKIENEKIKVPSSILPQGCLFSLLLILGFFVFFSFIFDFFWPFFGKIFWFSLISIVLIIVYKKNYRKKINTYRSTEILKQEFKSKVLPIITQSIYSDVSYSYKGAINENHIIASKLFSTHFFESTQKIDCEDIFKGKYENVQFEFCEITHYVEGLSAKKGFWLTLLFYLDIRFDMDISNLFEDEGLTETKKNFRGFFLYADFNKSFDGEVIIESKFRALFDSVFQKNNLDTIIVENEKINNKYSIKSSNPQLGYYVMSPQLIYAIEKINTLLGSTLKMTIRNGSLYMIIPLESNFFENYTIVNNKINFNPIETIKKELSVIKELLEVLNLNSRIWTKF